MRPSRLRQVALGVSVIAAVFLAYAGYVLSTLGEDFDSPRRRDFLRHTQSGEVLTFRQLAASEKIVVEEIKVGDRGQPKIWTFMVDGSRLHELVRLTRNEDYERGYGIRADEVAASDVFSLRDQDRVGLDMAIQCLRAITPREEPYYFQSWAIDYYRNDELIGEERLVANALAQHEFQVDESDIPAAGFPTASLSLRGGP